MKCANCQRRQFDPAPELPSHLPAPPKPKPPPKAPAASNTTGGGAGQIGGFLEGQPPLPPPQNGPLGPGLVPGQLVPFGLNHIILIIVPMFKMKFQKDQEWFTSKVKISMPITGKYIFININSTNDPKYFV